jgi:dihydrofolate reductase
MSDYLPGKVLWHVSMSVDGFIAGPDDSMDWLFASGGEPDPLADEVINTTGAILAGRRWYDLATKRFGGIEGIYGGAWHGRVFVLSHRPGEVPVNPAVTFLTCSIEDAVTIALKGAKGKQLVLFGSVIPRQCLVAGLVDEIMIHIVPILLGDGIRMYGDTCSSQVHLERTQVASAGQVTDLRFRVIK